MKDALTINTRNKRMVYGDTFSYPHKMDYIRITENLSCRNDSKYRENGLAGSPAMWWVAAGIVILSAMFLLCLAIG